MAGRSQRSVAVLLAFLALLTGVMGENLDTDLVGIVVAAVCIAILFIVLCSFLAFCCFRGVDLDRNWVVGRKDSGSVSNPSSRPPYTIVTDPIMYALPSPLHGDVFLEQRHTKLRHSDRLKETTQAIMAAPSQPNGHAVHDLPSSGINYRAIHTQDAGVGTTPLWLKKSYVETEKSLEIHEDDDEAEDGKPVSAPPSAKQPASSPQPQPVPQPQPQPPPPPQERGAGRAVRAEVSPKHSRLDSRDVLHVSEEFTIIDFVDPLQLHQHQHHQQQQQQQQRQQQQQQQQQQINGRPTYSYRSYLDRDFLHTTAITRYCVPKRHLADTSHGSSGSGYVPPVSTSTPRSPSDEGPAQPDTDHPRMRKPKEGSVRIMPVKSVGYKGDFQL